MQEIRTNYQIQQRQRKEKKIRRYESDLYSSFLSIKKPNHLIAKKIK